MPYIAFELDAMARAENVARARGVADTVIKGGLLNLWAHCFRETTDDVTREQVRAFMGLDAADDLVVFGFLETAGLTYRVRGAGRYLRLKKAYAAGAAKTNALRRRPKASDSVAIASPGVRSQTPSQRAASSEQQKDSSAAPKPPKKPSAQQEVFRWAQTTACALVPGRIPESEPDGATVNTQLKPHLASIGRVGLETAWQAYQRDPYALSKGLPWGLFVSKIPELHNRSQTHVTVKTRTLKPGEDPYADQLA